MIRAMNHGISLMNIFTENPMTIDTASQIQYEMSVT